MKIRFWFVFICQAKNDANSKLKQIASTFNATVIRHSFTALYAKKLVYYENYLTIEEAIAEEKRIKGGSRTKKIKLIESKNPEWRDLWEEIKNW